MAIEKKRVMERDINWLPLPGVDDFGFVPHVEENDFFSKAEVVDLYLRQGKGSVVNGNEEVMDFDLSDLELVGPKNDKRYLKVGGRVGYDVARSGKGVRITKLKIY